MLLGSGGGRSVCLRHCPSLVGAIGRAGLRKEVGLLRPEPRCPKMLRHQMVQWCAGGTEYPRRWHWQWGRQQFCWFFQLDKYAMFSFAMTSGLASDSDKFKIIITLRRAQKFGKSGPYKNLVFWLTHLSPNFFAILAKIECSTCGTVGTNGL